MINLQMLAKLKQKNSESFLNLLKDSSHLQAICNLVFAQIFFVITSQFLELVLKIRLLSNLKLCFGVVFQFKVECTHRVYR